MSPCVPLLLALLAHDAPSTPVAKPALERTCVARLSGEPEEAVAFASFWVDVPATDTFIREPAWSFGEDEVNVGRAPQERSVRLFFEGHFDPPRELPDALATFALRSPDDPCRAGRPIQLRRVKAILASGRVSRTFLVELEHRDAEGRPLDSRGGAASVTERRRVPSAPR